MNRTERAIKKSLKKTMQGKKREKHLALAEAQEHSFFDCKRKSDELSKLVKEEKGLKKWHRKILEDYTRRLKTPIKEEAVA